MNSETDLVCYREIFVIFFFLFKDFLRPDDLWAPSSGDMKSKCCICGLLRFEI